MEDESTIFSEHWTPEQLAERRAASADAMAAAGYPVTAFTCDECDLRAKCAFAFDGYNTGGDCLADK